MEISSFFLKLLGLWCIGIVRFFARKLLLDAYFELNPSTKHVLRHKTRNFLFFHLA